MKALRVLTGLHAGAQISLTAGSYRISGDEDADICISDWQVEPLVLVLGDDGVTRLYSENGDEVLIADFVAVPYGDVVFCVGPDGGVWPRDLELLAGLWKTATLATEDVTGSADTGETAEAADRVTQAADPSAAAVRHEAHPAGTAADADAATPAPRRLGWRTAALAVTCTAAVIGLATTGAMLTGAQPSEAANVKVDNDVLSKELAAALRRAGFADLQVAPRGDGVAVEGIVTSGEDGAKAHRIMEALAPGKVRRDYDVAQQDVDDIQQSLADTGAQVSYSGDGVFRVSGSVHEMDTFRERIASIRADLDRNVKRIDIDVKEARTPTPDVEYTEVVATGGLRYIETPDGTKHLFDSSPAKDHGNE